MFRTASLPGISALGRTTTATNPIDLTMDDEEEEMGSSRVATFVPRAGASGGKHEPFGSNWQTPAPPLSPARSRQQARPPENTGEKSMAPSTVALAGYQASQLPPLMQPVPIGLPSPLPPTMVARTSSLPAHSPIKPPPIIDLTSSPSPPPIQQHQHAQQRAPSASLPPAPPCTLPPDLPAKTPVCIGQLTCTALVLYPIDYVCPNSACNEDWVPVRYAYEHYPTKPIGARETIHVKKPDIKTPTGEMLPGDTFGVFEQRVATVLGPMLGKSLIRIDAKVQKKPSAVSQPLTRMFINVLKTSR